MALEGIGENSLRCFICEKLICGALLNRTRRQFQRAEMSSRDAHAVQQARNVVEQLRRERNIRRGFVSQSANDLIRYTQECQRDDVLLTGFSNEKLNPIRQRSSYIQCLLL